MSEGLWTDHRPKPKVVPLKPRRQQKPEPSLSWPEVTKEGVPKRSYRNARAAIAAMEVSLSYDEFHCRFFIDGPAIGKHVGEVSDAANGQLRQAIIDRYDFDPGKEAITDAMMHLCHENSFDPILDYLNSLNWDGVPRLDNWLSTYLGAEVSELHSAMGRLTLVAAVRRARQPGSKFDHILTLEGQEGTMKSSAIAVLAGTGNFSDQEILSKTEKEHQELIRGKWLYEIAELQGMKTADVGKIKAFASRTHDRARPAYGRWVIDAPRRCVFIGTTNESTYLQSDTGNRRFWPVKTGFIDLDALKTDRNQLWAEAAASEAQGGSLVLPPELWPAAEKAQEERRVKDPWDDLLSEVAGTTFGDDERVTTLELLNHKLMIPADRTTKQHAQRLARVMNRLGWEGPASIRFGTKTARGYSRQLTREVLGPSKTGVTA